MAELINKKDAIAIVNSIPCATLEEECTKSVAVGCIVRLPTTTEAEIRNRAIDDFAEKLSTDVESFVATVNGIEADLLTLDYFDEFIFDVAEQLKERE